MKKYIRHIGLAMIYLGVFVLLLSFVCGWTRSNAVLFPPLFLVVVGLILHVRMLKKESKY